MFNYTVHVNNHYLKCYYHLVICNLFLNICNYDNINIVLLQRIVILNIFSTSKALLDLAL